VSEIQCLWTPTPDPSPQGGGERVAAVAAVELNSRFP
jgi:hypothetical protein